jgi:hypothetical protein
MQFDTADLASMQANGTLNDVITHEMGHVLGIGTIWTAKGVLSGSYTLPNLLKLAEGGKLMAAAALDHVQAGMVLPTVPMTLPPESLAQTRCRDKPPGLPPHPT